MEIKTCEQYVLKRLEEAENDVEALKVDIQCKESEIQSLAEELATLKDIIRRRATITPTQDESQYISFESVWREFESDAQDFDVINAIMEGK